MNLLNELKRLRDSISEVIALVGAAQDTVDYFTSHNDGYLIGDLKVALEPFSKEVKETSEHYLLNYIKALEEVRAAVMAMERTQRGSLSADVMDALEFYANEKNWQSTFYPTFDTSEPLYIEGDNGKRARDSLAKLRGEE